MRHSVSLIPGSMSSSFPRCLAPVVTALVERGAILRFLLSERIVEIAERDYGIRRTSGAAVASAHSAYGEPPRSSEPSTDCNGSRFGSGVDAELDEEVGHVGLDRA